MMLTNSPGKPHKRNAPEVADEVLELLKGGKIQSLGKISEAVGIENLEKLEELLDLVEGMKLIEKGYTLTDLGKRAAEWPMGTTTHSPSTVSLQASTRTTEKSAEH